MGKKKKKRQQKHERQQRNRQRNQKFSNENDNNSQGRFEFGKKNKKKYNKGKKGKNQHLKKESQYQNDYDELNSVLNKFGMNIVEVFGDGNCLWRSISEYLENDQNKFNHYKNKTIDFIEKNEDYFSPYITRDFKEYIAEIRQRGEWGDDLCLFSFSKAFEKNVIVHQNGKANLEFHNGKNEDDTVHLSYHLSEHYNCVKKNNQFKDEYIKRKPSNDPKKKKKKKKKPIISEMQMNIIMDSTGCNNIGYIKKVFKNFKDVNQTVQTLLMERNIYEIKGIKVKDYWTDVVVEESDEESDGDDEEEKSKGSFKQVNTKRRLTKRQKREEEKKRKKREANERKKNYLTKKQKRLKEQKEKEKKEKMKKQNSNDTSNEKDEEPLTHIETIQI